MSPGKQMHFIWSDTHLEEGPAGYRACVFQLSQAASFPTQAHHVPLPPACLSIAVAPPSHLRLVFST